MVRLVVDILHLRDNDGNIVTKELAIANPDTNSIQSWIFEAPFPWSQLSTSIQSTNVWYSTRMHGLDWNYGEISYSHLKTLLVSYVHASSIIYAYGQEKTEYLSRILSHNVINLQTLPNCPSHFISLPILSCCYPQHQYINYDCAVRQVHALSKFIQHLDFVGDRTHSVYSVAKEEEEEL